VLQRNVLPAYCVVWDRAISVTEKCTACILCGVGHGYQCYREMYCLHIQDRHKAHHPANYMASHIRKPHILIVYFLGVQPQKVNLQIWMDDYNPTSFSTFPWDSQTIFYMHWLSPPSALRWAQYTLLYALAVSTFCVALSTLYTSTCTGCLHLLRCVEHTIHFYISRNNIW
jgi:hypothetical protein